MDALSRSRLVAGFCTHFPRIASWDRRGLAASMPCKNGQMGKDQRTRQVFLVHQCSQEALKDNQAGGGRDEPYDKRLAAAEGKPADNHCENQ